MDNEKISYARAFLKKAESELKLAKIAINHGNYAESCYLSQQAAEKACKALLILFGKEIYEHVISGYVNEVISEYLLDELKEVPKLLLELEEHWLKSRYPLKKFGKIFDPLEYYTREIAEEAYKKAEKVVRKIKEFLKEKFDLEL